MRLIGNSRLVGSRPELDQVLNIMKIRIGYPCRDQRRGFAVKATDARPQRVQARRSLRAGDFSAERTRGARSRKRSRGTEERTDRADSIFL